VLLPQLRTAFDTFTSINRLTQDTAQSQSGSWDALGAVHQILIHPELRASCGELVELRNDCTYLRKECFRVTPRVCKSLEFQRIRFRLAGQLLVKTKQREYDQLLRRISLSHKLQKAFTSIPNVNYGDEQSSLEDLVTVQMTYLLDERS